MNRILGYVSVAVLLASAPAAALAGNYKAGEEKAKACAACHGAGGNSTIPDNPKLAGQHYDYIVKSLQGYKSGVRKNPIMKGMADPLTQRDMENLAEYFSKQQGLVTAK
jgi:cytochrome c553